MGQQNTSRISATVVIPCRDEAESLPAIIRALPAGIKALVVDNGSVDSTADVAAALGCTVVRQPLPGYGSAVHAGVEACTTEIVCTIDGDGSMDPADLTQLVAAVAAGADLAVGRRRPVDRRTWPLHSRLGTQWIARRLRNRYRIPIHDIGPMRAVRRDDLLGLGITDRRFGYPVELLARAGAARWQITELDITYRPRSGGRSKVSGSLKGTLRATRDFLTVLHQMEERVAH
ncbi:glycosyltransferase family 2 protein [Williamsia sp. 1135]|uniref:glycosyltransferase family 2 protein n=1 Tax=Williamsia sp. 1135 TaxID=1889262 RepID=UPI000A116243|nr:glycosyltransferase family 2 protein [Williamsia sp. 1135]ORM30594.1 glycosyltransferase [Williamsia sp. 1135]